MAVSEIALIRLKPQDLSPATRANLVEAQKAQTAYSEHQVHFLRQVEDSSFFYLLGGWESVAKHTDEWIQSETNQKLLAQLGEDFDVSWMFHLDVDPSTSRIPLDAPVLAISRYFVDPNSKDEFENAFKAGSPGLGAYTAPFSYCGAWRIDKEGEDEEFVLFSGWNEVQDHFAFAESKEFETFGKIKNYLKGAEIKHVRLQKWE